MAQVVEYYLVPHSPWTYLGHERLRAVAKVAGATIEPVPFDLGKVFPVSGGLPLPKRAPQRQAYRLVELRRFKEHLGMPLVVQPRFFPVDADLATRVVIAVQIGDGPERALDLAGAMLRAVWAEERDIADPATLAALLAETGLSASRLAEADAAEARARLDANTRRAIDAGVFGAPSYVIDGEIFWGQDRLEFVQRRLER